MSLLGLLTGCGLGRPGASDVAAAIEDAPGVTHAEVSLGAGGGSRSVITAAISTDVGADELRATAEDAWGRGVGVLHRMYDGERGHEVGAVTATAADGTEFSLRDLIDLGASKAPTLGHYYDHYGVG